MFIKNLVSAMAFGIRAMKRFTKINVGEYVVYEYGEEKLVNFEDFRSKVIVTHMFSNVELYQYKNGKFIVKGKGIFGIPWIAIARPGDTQEEKEFFELSD